MDFNNLTEDEKAKARTCETPEDILALASEEGYELSDDELESVSGGWDGGCGDYDCGMVGH